MPLKKAEQKIKRVYTDPDRLADELAERMEASLGKRKPIQRIRNSHFLSGFVGVSGLALLILGVEKVFGFLSGPALIIIGLSFLAASGALLKQLNR